jgi:Domain of unknown function (DUF4136)
MRAIPRLLISAAVAIVPLLPTTAFAQRTSYDYRAGRSFSNIKTFAFKDSSVSAPQDAEQTTTYDSPFIEERVKAAITAQLQRRGITLSDTNPDVYVSTHRSYDKTYSVYGGYGWGPYSWASYGWGPYGYNRFGWGADGYTWAGWPYWGPTYVEERIEGTLAIDLEDATTGQLIWRGVGTKHVHKTSKPSHRIARINDAVEDIFKKFPATAVAVGDSRR